MKSPTIKTERCTIRPFTKENALLWQTWDIDPEIQVHMPEPKNEPRDIGEQYKYIEECESDKEGYYWSIEVSASMHPDQPSITIGTISLFEINIHHKTANLGIVIRDKEYFGKGIATEVVKALVQYAFSDLDIIKISAEIEVPNIVMQKVLQKVGFEQDGLFRSERVKESGRVDVVHFGIIKQPVYS